MVALDSTYELLVDAALAEFAEKGFAGTSRQMIGARAKVGMVVVQHYFKTREELASAIIDRMKTHTAPIGRIDFSELGSVAAWQEAVRQFLTRFVGTFRNEETKWRHFAALYRHEYNTPALKQRTLWATCLVPLRETLRQLVAMGFREASGTEIHLWTMSIWSNLLSYCFSTPQRRDASFPDSLSIPERNELVVKFLCANLFQGTDAPRKSSTS